MTPQEEILEKIDTLSEEVKDYSRFSMIFSDDAGKRTLAKISRLMQTIKSLVHISGIKNIKFPTSKPLVSSKLYKQGSLVKIRPCDAKYDGKTYLGFLIGELALGSSIEVKDDALVCEWSHYNPAIFVPELGEVITGSASWWGEIKSADELSEITNADISEVWYVKLLKDLQKKSDEQSTQ